MREERASLRWDRSQLARVLANGPLERGMEAFQPERAGSAQCPHRTEAEPSMDPALGQTCPDLSGLQGYCPMKRHAGGSVSDMLGPLPRLSPATAFPLRLGLS